MKIDLTYQLTKEKMDSWTTSMNAKDKGLMSIGHMGTHFDTMNKEFTLDLTELNGIVFDVSKNSERDIEISDIEIEKISAGDFILLYTGTIEKFEYYSQDYSEKFPQLSWDLIKLLVEKKVKIIGVDTRGLRKDSEHPTADKFCADNGTFVIENLVNLGKLFQESAGKKITIHTYPLNMKNFTGIPSRVIAEF